MWDSRVLLSAHLTLQRRQPSAHNVVIGLGAVAWCAAAADWLSGADPSAFAPLLGPVAILLFLATTALAVTGARRREPRCARIRVCPQAAGKMTLKRSLQLRGRQAREAGGDH